MCNTNQSMQISEEELLNFAEHNSCVMHPEWFPRSPGCSAASINQCLSGITSILSTHKVAFFILTVMSNSMFSEEDPDQEVDLEEEQ